MAMTHAPERPDSGGKAPRPRPRLPKHWADAAAFVTLIAGGGIAVALLGDATAVALATTCTAFGALYGVWKRLRVPRDDPPENSEADDDPEDGKYQR
jgi:hypothetical protein